MALRPAVVVAAVAVLSVLPYVPALGGEWLFDDQLLIERNRYVHSLRHVLWWLSHDVWDLDNFVTQSGNRLAYFRPVLLASYALDWVASGGNPVWFHFTNLIWHALGSVLVYSAFRRWIGPDSGSRSMWPPLIAALRPRTATDALPATCDR